MPAPTCTTAPVISGTATVGSTLTSTSGVWSNKEPVTLLKLASGALKKQMDIEAATVAGTQGERELTATLFSASGAAIDAARKYVRIPLLEGGESIIPWWRTLGSNRSGRTDKRRSGPSYWSGSDQLNHYERAIGYADAFNVQMPMGWKGGHNSLTTMARTTGGPTNTENNTIDPDGQLNFDDNRSPFVNCWKFFPKGTICCLTFVTTSHDRATHLDNSAIWQEIIDKDWDKAYISLGRRLVVNIQENNPKGHDLDHLMLRFNHENNQSNHNEVFHGQEDKYKRSHERIIDLIRTGINREGGNGGDVKCWHAPAQYNDTPGGNGRYYTACPENVDGYSASFHSKRSNVYDQASLEKDMAENLKGFNFNPYEVANYAHKRNRPLMWPEWSPRYEADRSRACPYAHGVVKEFDRFLKEQQDQTLCNMVFYENILSPTAYQLSDAAGKLEWSNMAKDFPNRMGGPNKKPPA